MGNALEIKKRIGSVKNIAQVTRALEAVSASRVRRAQAAADATRNYAEKAWEILLNVQSTARQGVALHPLLTQREEVKKRRVILITSDRGLAGSYNTNVIRVASQFKGRTEVPIDFVTVGRKGRDSMIRDEEDVIAEFSNMPPEPSVSDIRPIVRSAIDDFLSGVVDEVFVAYTDFINTLTQRPVILRLLPLVPYETDDQALSEYVKDVPDVTSGISEYEFEPTPTAVLDEVVPRFTELQLYQAVLESLASEHASRMVAMKNASDNATELVGDLTLDYNKARQTEVTNEILDIVGGAEALAESVSKQTGDIRSAESIQSSAVVKKNVVEDAKDAVVTIEKNEPEKPKPKTRRKKASGGGDDLTKIEGIGPKMSRALIAAGIDTFEKLSKASEDDIRGAIDAAGMRLAPGLGTWAEQAEYLVRGDETGLQAFQDTLVGGRRVDDSN
jgi:F-type H+-transporting ATPase subunit gamma